MSFSKVRQKGHSIKDLPESDRPREKLFSKGPENLTDAELIALLINTGSRRQNAVSLAETMLKKFPLNKLPKTDKKAVNLPGIGKGKAARIFAALELGERLFSPQSITKIVIRTHESIIAQCKEIAGKHQEYLLSLYLNARHELIQRKIIALGQINALSITPREIFLHAVNLPCTEFILAHNHPSGNPNPSTSDIQFTRRVQEAGIIMGIPLLDHIIVSETGFFSFKDNRVY